MESCFNRRSEFVFGIACDGDGDHNGQPGVYMKSVKDDEDDEELAAPIVIVDQCDSCSASSVLLSRSTASSILLSRSTASNDK